MNDDDSNDTDDSNDILTEYLAVVARVDEAVAAATAKASGELRCSRGCDRCCAPGLSVLPVEAERIARFLDEREVEGGVRADRCVFLDRTGACQVYAARPVLCRTHGLALRTREAPGRGLRILDDVSFCELNYTNRSPTPAETLDADRVWALVVTVDRRFRLRVGLPDDDQRVALTALAFPQPKAT